MDIFKSRRSVRSYKEEMIKKEELNEILEAGSYAPSGGNNQTTHRIVILNKAVRKELRELVQQEFAKMEIQDGMYKSLQHSITLSKKGSYRYDFEAPVLVITANKKGYGNAIADSACMIENMMLKATQLQIGSCWINQLHWLDENPVIRRKLQELGLGEDETVTGGLALGYAKVEPKGELKRSGNPITMVE